MASATLVGATPHAQVASGAMSTTRTVAANDFRAALARWASGVTVVTAAGPDGPVGLTASAFTSLSLDPPLVLVCVGQAGASHDPVIAAPGFAVHLLGEDQEHLSARFARARDDRFTETEWEPGPFGAPLIPGCLARLVCARESAFEGGDHTILVGRVTDVELDDGRPLVYWMGGYRGLTPTV